MNQSNTIFAAIFLAFVVFITVRGKLRQYMGLLIDNGPAVATGTIGSTAQTANTPAANSLAGGAASLAAAAANLGKGTF